MGRRRSHYGRPSPRKVAGEPERAVFPLLMAEFKDFHYAFAPASPYKLARDPEFLTYELGDVIYVRTSPEKVEIAKIIGVKAEVHHMSMSNGKRVPDEYIPRWKVQFLNKNGYWSQLWKYVWPGDVFRAYHDPETKVPVFRPDFLLEEFLDALK